MGLIDFTYGSRGDPHATLISRDLARGYLVYHGRSARSPSIGWQREHVVAVVEALDLA